MEKLPIRLLLESSFFEEETNCDFLVTKDRKRIWAVELDLLNEFIQFCQKYNIEYYAIGGTLLGAVRHRGYIPWDDDIDLAVPRNEYERLCQLAPDYFVEPYFFQNMETDYGITNCISRLRNSKTTAVPLYDAECKHTYNQGIWIDIFPLDNIPDELKERTAWINLLQNYHKKSWGLSRYTLRYKTKFEKESILKKTRFIIGPLAKAIMTALKIPNQYTVKYNSILKKYAGSETDEWGLLWFYNEKETTVWKKEWFRDTVSLPFESLQVTVPAGYDNILRKQYGDYMKMVIGGSVHHSIIFDTETPYKEYVNDPDSLRRRALIKW